MQKDNSTLASKLRLRRMVMGYYTERAPVVLETHAGYGRVFERVWYRAATGMVIEKDPRKIEALCVQRPHWRVYEGDTEAVLAAGLGRDLAFDIMDVDPYGSPFPIFDGLFTPERPFPDRWYLVVNDGLRQGVQRGRAWNIEHLQPIVARRGNNLFPVYLDVAREMVDLYAARIGFKVTAWAGNYAGHHDLMTHYVAQLEREKKAGADQPQE